MVDERLTRYIKQSISQGVPLEQLKQSLLNSGWRAESIEEATEQVTNLLKGKPVPGVSKQQTTAPPKKPPLFKILVILGILIGFGIVSIFAYYQYKGITSRKKDEAETDLGYGTQSGSVDNLTVVFVEATKDLDDEKVVFYDIRTQTRLEDIADFTNPGYLYSLGQWSPDGKYLPIHVSALPDNQTGESSGEILLFMYDSEQHTAKEIYKENKSDEYEERIIYSDVNYASGWLDEEKFGYRYDKDVENNKVTIKYITYDGLRGEETIEDNRRVSNDRLTIEYLGDNQTNSNREIYIDGQEILIKTEGEVSGLVDDFIVIFNQAEPQYDYTDLSEANMDPNLEAELNEIESSNLSEEEKEQKIVDLLEPKGASTIHLINVTTLVEEEAISLDDEQWVVRSVQVHPKESILLVHETDSLYSSKKHRIYKIPLQDLENKDIIVSEDIVGDLLIGSLLEEGVSFHITSDGSGVIYYEDKAENDPFNRDIIMISLSSKEKRTICSTYCTSYKVYNPTQLMFGY